MLRFFRKLRQGLLKDNNFSRYFLYAIGEILLVMIGILLALQVNNWNEERIIRKKEYFYLKALKDEFETNQKELSRVKLLNSKNLDHAQTMSKYMGIKNNALSQRAFDSLAIGTVGSEVQYRPGEGVMRELIQSGNLGILSNNELRQKLASWDGLMTRVRFQEAEHARPRLEMIRLVEEKGNMRKSVINAFGGFPGLVPSKFEESSFELISSLELDNYITGFIATGVFLNNGYYARLEKEIDRTLDLIEQELEGVNGS
ncbi:DUF6090 family protein [Robiginitalea sp. IMCC43444]|uniref:DUF6090 family protein n=1 Tax=Robiginitalea sp. IMCC43444 TaxID=3459121 RepID=UPI0040429FCA